MARTLKSRSVNHNFYEEKIVVAGRTVIVKTKGIGNALNYRANESGIWTPANHNKVDTPTLHTDAKPEFAGGLNEEECHTRRGIRTVPGKLPLAMLAHRRDADTEYWVNLRACRGADDNATVDRQDHKCKWAKAWPDTELDFHLHGIGLEIRLTLSGVNAPGIFGWTVTKDQWSALAIERIKGVNKLVLRDEAGDLLWHYEPPAVTVVGAATQVTAVWSMATDGDHDEILITLIGLAAAWGAGATQIVVVA